MVMDRTAGRRARGSKFAAWNPRRSCEPCASHNEGFEHALCLEALAWT